MRIVCISDTHGLTDNLIVPDGDVLVHAGDFCSIGNKMELSRFNEFLSKLPHRHKVFIAGNHDVPVEMGGREFVKKQIPQAIYLQDSSVKIDGLKFYGSPWQPEFFNWAFNLPRGRELARKWGLISKDTDILITHGPPAGVLDTVRSGEHVGCGDLRRYVDKIKPKVHVFGHIHESYGMEERDGTLFVNASTCTGNYQPINPPIVVDVQNSSGEAVLEKRKRLNRDNKQMLLTPKPKYTLDELLAHCDPNAPMSKELQMWIEAPAVGNELL